MARGVLLVDGPALTGTVRSVHDRLGSPLHPRARRAVQLVRLTVAVLAIDFDGVLHDHTNPVPGRIMGPPHDGAEQAMRELAQAGHTLIVHTCRETEHVGAWLDYWHVPHDAVTNRKPNADVYVDDRALRHRDWTSTMTALGAILG